MAAETKGKAKRGRPRTTGPGFQVNIRCQQKFLDAVDEWRVKQPGELTRSQAIMQLAWIALLGR